MSLDWCYCDHSPENLDKLGNYIFYKIVQESQRNWVIYPNL